VKTNTEHSLSLTKNKKVLDIIVFKFCAKIPNFYILTTFE
jgi:hypothetical protein